MSLYTPEQTTDLNINILPPDPFQNTLALIEQIEFAGKVDESNVALGAVAGNVIDRARAKLANIDSVDELRPDIAYSLRVRRISALSSFNART